MLTDAEKEYVAERCHELGCNRNCYDCDRDKCIRQKIVKQIYYKKNRDKLIKRTMEWQKNNKERYLESSRNTYHRNKYKYDRTEYYRSYYLKKKEEQMNASLH